MRISDWSSDVCSSDLPARLPFLAHGPGPRHRRPRTRTRGDARTASTRKCRAGRGGQCDQQSCNGAHRSDQPAGSVRSEEHTSELQSLMRISYAVFCLKKKKHHEATQMTYSTVTNN